MNASNNLPRIDDLKNACSELEQLQIEKQRLLADAATRVAAIDARAQILTNKLVGAITAGRRVNRHCPRLPDAVAAQRFPFAQAIVSALAAHRINVGDLSSTLCDAMSAIGAGQVYPEPYEAIALPLGISGR